MTFSTDTITTTFTEADRQRWAEYDRQNECITQHRRELQSPFWRVMTMPIGELLGRMACRLWGRHSYGWSHNADGRAWYRCPRCRRWKSSPSPTDAGEGGGT